VYGADVHFDGMLYATIARPAVYGGKVKSLDDSAALKVPGVLKVIQIESRPLPSEFQPLGGVAVVASNTWAAIKGREALKIEWDDGPNASYDSIAYRKELEAASLKPGKVVRNTGDIDKALSGAASTLEASYYLPHLAQAPMEPMVAIARYTDGVCEAWAPSQAPQVTRERIAERLGLPFDNVTFNVTLLGGGFGRKSKPDFVVEAAILAKEFPGKAVRVQWTREDDIHNSYFHTVSAEYLKAGVGKDGMPSGWLHRTVAPSITALFAPGMNHEAAFELGMGFTNMAYAIPNVRLENPEATVHTRVGWYRSVSNIPHGFAIQSFVDELAHKAGEDPLKYQIKLLGPDRQIDPRTLERRVELRRISRALSDRHRAHAHRAGNRCQSCRLGAQTAQGAWSRVGGALQLRHLRGGGDRSRGQRRRHADRAQGGYCCRLRAADQPRAHSLAVRRCLRDGPG
jgi:isoquinoline 1-oxidoreductase beta subunit